MSFAGMVNSFVVEVLGSVKQSLLSLWRASSVMSSVENLITLGTKLSLSNALPISGTSMTSMRL